MALKLFIINLLKLKIYHNKEKNINELWLKMCDIETQIGHSDIANVVLGENQKTLW